MAFLLSRNIQFEEDLVDQLFNSSERRLARVLLLLANFGKEGKLEAVMPPISQELLAARVGTTCPPHQLLHEQIPEAGPHRIQRPPEGTQRDFSQLIVHDYVAPARHVLS